MKDRSEIVDQLMYWFRVQQLKNYLDYKKKIETENMCKLIKEYDIIKQARYERRRYHEQTTDDTAAG